MMHFKHVLLILNPFSRTGRTAQLVPSIREAAESIFGEVTLRLTTQKGHATEIALSEGKKADLVIACGGDGTVHEVAKGLVQSSTNVPMGVLPLGSGNDYARALHMPLAIKAALQAISNGRMIASDTGRVSWMEEAEEHEGFFINALGVGFDAHTASLAPAYKGMPFGIGYTVAILAGLKTWVSGGATLRSGTRNGDVVFNGRLMFVTIGNAQDSGGGYTVNPGALITDGKLDPCIVENMSIPRALMLLPKARNGGHIGLKGVTYVRLESLNIETDRGLPIHADGEILSLQARTIQVDVQPGSLNVIVLAAAPDLL